MADNHSKAIRSKNMSHIRSTSTKPEEDVRHFLYHQGFRYRKNVASLPGKPDVVLSKYKTVIFVNGCFWHMHNCQRFKWPKSNTDYWEPKLVKNSERDKENKKKLLEMGWHVITIWECELTKTRFNETMNRVIDEIREEAELL